MENKSKKYVASARSFLDPLFLNNPLFVMLLGLCPALGTTSSFESALGMGVLFTFVVVCSNTLVSLLRNIIPEEVETPCEIVIIATFVTIVDMLCHAFVPALYSSISSFIALLVVNCIVLGRAQAFAKKNGVVDSILDGVGNGLGYMWAIMVIGLLREVLGTGSLKLFSLINFGFDPIVLPILGGWGGISFTLAIPFFQSSAGGYVMLGLVLAVLAAINNKKKAKEAAAKREAMKAAAAARAAAAAKAAADKAAASPKPAPVAAAPAPAATENGGNK